MRFSVVAENDNGEKRMTRGGSDSRGRGVTMGMDEREMERITG